MDDLHELVYHPGQQRLSMIKGTGLEKANKVHAWTEDWMARFIEQIQRTPYRSAWDPDRADPSKFASTRAEERTDTNLPETKIANLLP